jgi:hypothetical protein
MMQIYISQELDFPISPPEALRNYSLSWVLSINDQGDYLLVRKVPGYRI